MGHMSTVIDFHDDGGLLLVEAGNIPGYIKQASALSLEEVDALPEDLFALVLVDGNRRFKKFACHDPAHTEISTFYLAKTYRSLPLEAVKVAATNLASARSIYGLPALDFLSKLAASSGEPKGLGYVAEPKEGPKATGEGTPGAEKPDQVLSPSEKVRPTEPDTMSPDESKERANQLEDLLLKYIENRREGLRLKVAEGRYGLSYIPKDDSQETFDARDKNRGERPPDIHVASLKSADLTGTEVMPVGAKPNAPKDVKKMAEHGNVVAIGPTINDVWPIQEKVAHRAGPLPLDTLSDIKKAEDIFSDTIKLASISPDYRAPIARAITARESELGLLPGSGVAAYAGEFYKSAEELGYALQGRVRLANRLGKKANFDTLVAVRRNYPARDYAEKLAQLDRKYGFDSYWNTEWIDDPWKATLGFEKRSTIVYSKGDVFVSDKHIEWLAKNERQHLTKILDEDIVNEFRKNPVSVFESLPDNLKKVLGRLAMDRTWHGEVRET